MERRPRGPAGSRAPWAPRVATGLVLTVWSVLALSVAVATPPWEANDEPDHVRNVQALADGRWYRIAPGSGFEAHQGPAYYLVLAGWQRLLGVPARAEVAPPLRPPEEGGVRGNFVHDHPGDGRDQRLVTTLRLPGIALGLLTLLLTAAAAGRASADPWAPAVAAAWVAGVPKLAFLAGVVNNDNLTHTLGAAGVVLAVSALRAAPLAGRRALLAAAALGAVAGAAVLAKLTAAWLAPALLLAVVLAAAPHRTARGAAVAVFGLAAVAMCGWWLVQNAVRYGDPLAAGATKEHLEALFPPIFAVGSAAHQLLDVAPRTFYETFWYSSGYNQFDWRWYVYLPLWVGLALALAGLAVRRRPLPAPPRVVAVLLAIVAGAVVSFALTALQTTTAQARTSFFALPALACLAALGLERARVPVPLRFLLPAAGAVGTLVALQRDVVAVYAT